MDNWQCSQLIADTHTDHHAICSREDGLSNMYNANNPCACAADNGRLHGADCYTPRLRCNLSPCITCQWALIQNVCTEYPHRHLRGLSGPRVFVLSACQASPCHQQGWQSGNDLEEF